MLVGVSHRGCVNVGNVREGLNTHVFRPEGPNPTALGLGQRMAHVDMPLRWAALRIQSIVHLSSRKCCKKRTLFWRDHHSWIISILVRSRVNIVQPALCCLRKCLTFSVRKRLDKIGHRLLQLNLEVAINHVSSTEHNRQQVVNDDISQAIQLRLPRMRSQE